MTPQELCEKIKKLREAEMAEVLEASSDIPEDECKDALTDKWLKDNVDLVYQAISKPGVAENELIGLLESNAFMASFQRAYESSRRSRVRRWAGIYSKKNRDVQDDGVLVQLLPNIGVRVDDEFVESMRKGG